jgi:hypothetical protein
VKKANYDIENSSITLNQVITILYQIFVVGNAGTRKSFIPFKQYIICGETTVSAQPDECTTCEDRLPYTSEYWKVCIDSEEFLVPKVYATIEGYIRTETEQDLRKLWDKLYVNQPKDYKKMIKDITGRDINTGNSDISNQELYKEIQRIKGKNNGKQYFQVEIEG